MSRLLFLSGPLDGVDQIQKMHFFFSEHPTVHTETLTTDKGRARAEGPTIVLRMEMLMAVSMMLTAVTLLLTADGTTDPLQEVN